MRKKFLLAGLLLAGNAHAWSTISFYGDSFTYRSGWNCDGLGMTSEQCAAYRADSSFVSYVAHPYSWTTTPVFDVVAVDGVGGSTCLGASNNPQPLSDRLQDRNEAAIAVMIGINDVNLGGRTVQETVSCIVSVWTTIADVYGATPIAVTYPPIDPSAVTWEGWETSGTEAAQNAVALNQAIIGAANAFNQDRGPGETYVQVVNFGNAYSPAPGGYTIDGAHPNPTGALQLARFFYWALH